MKAADHLKDLEKKYQQKYGVAVFDIEIKNTKSGVEIKGKVLTENQKDDVLRILKNKKIKIMKENIKVLGDANFRNELGWAVVKNKIIDLKSRFVSNKIINDKILNRIRCSQAVKDEVLRVLYKKEDQLLIQQNDLTLGWVDGKDVILKKVNSSPDKGRLGGIRNRRRLNLHKEWEKGGYALKGEVIKIINTSPTPLKRGIGTVEPAISLRNRIIKEAEKYLGVKYVLGGKSEKGIDCSGLVQLAYKNSLDVILPRHSWDQKEIGRKVKLENLKSGDLVFLIKKENGHKHMGIAEVILKNNPPTPLIRGASNSSFSYQKGTNLIHASLGEKKVVRQDLKKVFEKYDFVEARRVAEQKGIKSKIKKLVQSRLN